MFSEGSARPPSRRDRFEVRKAFHAEVQLAAAEWHDTVDLPVRDLSAGGMFVATELPLEEGAQLVVSFEVATCPRKITVFGQVVRVSMPRRRSDKQPAGMGIRFTDITPLERLLVRSALQDAPLPLPTS